MGGFPSHDAAGFLYTTAVQHPNSGGSVEICLVPLLRRYFNDNNKKLKDAVTQIYFKGPPNATQTVQSMHQQHHQSVSLQSTPPASPPASPPAADALTPPGDAVSRTSSMGASRDDRKSHAMHAYRAMEHLLGEIEASFYSNTRVVYECADMVDQKLKEINALRKEQHDNAEAELMEAAAAAQNNEGADGSKPNADDEAGEGNNNNKEEEEEGAAASAATASSAGQRTPPPPKMERVTSSAQLHAALHRNIPSHLKHDSAQWPLMRPVPCAICVIEPEGSGRSKGNNNPTTAPGSPHIVNGVAITDWANVQGRKLHCIGYLSLFSSDALNPRHIPKGDTRRTATPIPQSTNLPATPSVTVGASPSPSYNIPRLVHCPENGYDVYLELVLENEEKFRYLTEHILFLASMTFRSQFMTCSMWHRPTSNKEVEETYYKHLQLLNIHVLMNKDKYHNLKSFYEQFPLMELVEEMGLVDKTVLRQCGSLRTTRNNNNNDTLGTTASDDLNSMSSPAALEQLIRGLPQVNGEMGVAEAAAAMLEALEKENITDEKSTTSGCGPSALLNSGASGQLTTMTDGGTLTTTDREGSPGRRGRRSRRRQRKNRSLHEYDEIYRQTTCRMPKFSFYETHTGGSGVEAVFDGALLARMMKFVTETAAFETVKGHYVRCDLGPLMKERRHLLQAYREALQDYLDADEEAQRLLGSELIASSLKTWLKDGAEAEEVRKQMALVQAQKAAAAASAPPMMMPHGMPTAAQAAPGTQAPVMFVPGVGYVAAPQHMMMAGAAAAAAPMVAQPQPQYFFNAATGQMMMAAAAPQPAPQQPYMVQATPQMMQQLYYANAAQQAQQQQQQAQQQHQLPPPPPPPLPPQQQQQQQPAQVGQQLYQYMMGPNGQLMAIPIAAPQPQPQLMMQQYSIYGQQPSAHPTVTVGGPGMTHFIQQQPGVVHQQAMQQAVQLQQAQQQAQQQQQQQHKHQRSGSNSMSQSSLPSTTPATNSPTQQPQQQQQHAPPMFQHAQEVKPAGAPMTLGGHAMQVPYQMLPGGNMVPVNHLASLVQQQQQQQAQQQQQQQQQAPRVVVGTTALSTAQQNAQMQIHAQLQAQLQAQQQQQQRQAQQQQAQQQQQQVQQQQAQQQQALQQQQLLQAQQQQQQQQQTIAAPFSEPQRSSSNPMSSASPFQYDDSDDEDTARALALATEAMAALGQDDAQWNMWGQE